MSMTLVLENEAPFHASHNRSKFHRPNCKWAREISPYNLLIFRSHQDAVQAGYRACGTCSP